jgi:hypothetical protein
MVLLFGGYFVVALGLMKAIWTHYLLISFLLFLVGQGSFCAYISAISTNVKNFSEANRSKVIDLF